MYAPRPYTRSRSPTRGIPAVIVSNLPSSRRRTLLALSALALLGVACGPTLHTALESGASFDGYGSVAFAGRRPPPEGFERHALTDEQRRIAMSAARETLLAKGWREAPVEEADVVIYAGVGKREKKQDLIAGTGVLFETKVTEGGLVVEAFDRATEAPLWHGTVQATREYIGGLRGAVKALLEEFPAPGR